MKQVYFFFLFILASAFSACSDYQDMTDGDRYDFLQSYIPVYASSDGFTAIRATPGDARGIHIVWGGDREDCVKHYLPVDAPHYDYPENDFMKYATRNNDLQYNEIELSGSYFHRTACSDNFKSVHVVAAEEWDEKHPAGSLLDELFSLKAVSYAPFIREEYQGTEQTKIDKLLSDLTAEDLSMLNVEMEFFAKSLPADTHKIHELTFTFVTDEGVEKPTTIRYSWADGVIE